MRLPLTGAFGNGGGIHDPIRPARSYPARNERGAPQGARDITDHAYGVGDAADALCRRRLQLLTADGPRTQEGHSRNRRPQSRASSTTHQSPCRKQTVMCPPSPPPISYGSMACPLSRGLSIEPVAYRETPRVCAPLEQINM